MQEAFATEAELAPNTFTLGKTTSDFPIGQHSYLWYAVEPAWGVICRECWFAPGGFLFCFLFFLQNGILTHYGSGAVLRVGLGFLRFVFFCM